MTASRRSAGGTRGTAFRALLVVVAAGLAAAAPSPAAAGIAAVRGHVGIGYAKLFVSGAPGGSLSAEGGLDHPVGGGLRVGANLGYHLLGGRTVERGSLVANVDYSAFTAALQVHWQPRGLGPLARVSAGPALVNGHAELSTSGGGALFADLARGETAGGLALDATLMRRADAPVRIGLELGTRIGFFPDESWTLGTARLVFHY